MKKIGMLILASIVVLGTGIFVFINNEAYCADQGLCSNTAFSQTGTILPYSDLELQNALARGDKLGFYFEAARCANCKLLKDDLIARGIPAGATVLITDFDKAQELRAKYQVNNLHTIVVVDQDLNMISKDETGEYDKLIHLLK